MSNRMDNLQTVFDRTDWQALRAMRMDLLSAIVEIHRLNTLGALALWLETVENAARMDGYQTKKEPAP